MVKKTQKFNIFINIYLPNSSARAGCDTRLIFRQSLKGLNSEFSVSLICFFVAYWPSTEPSIKRCTCVNKQKNSGNRCIRSKILEYHLDLWTWLNSVMRTPTGSRQTSDNYITRCHRRLWSVAVGVRVPVTVGDKMPTEWEPAPDSGLAPSVTPGWAAQPEC